MKFTTVAAAAGFASLASAQGPVFHESNDSYICPTANGAYCASDSLQSNIIIRCTNYEGQPGNCNDNLAGYPPVGVNFAPCFTCGANSSRSACSKDGIVRVSSGANLGSMDFAVNASAAVCSAPVNSTTGGNGGMSPNNTMGGGSASQTGSYGSSSTGSGSGSAGNSSGSGSPAPYTGGASGVSTFAASAVVGFGAVLAAIGM